MDNSSYLHSTPPVPETGTPRSRLDGLIIRVRTWLVTAIVLALIVLVAWGTLGVASTIQHTDATRVTTSADVELVKRARLCPETEAAARVVELAPGVHRVQCWDGVTP